MANERSETAAKVVLDVGKELNQQVRVKSCVNKDNLVKLLKKAEDNFPVLGQSPSLKPAIEPLSDFICHNLLQHKDKDVRVLAASCLCQIIRVLAPDPPYSDKILRDIFSLIVSMFTELSDTNSPYFTRRVKILETVARLKLCVLMVDIGCDDLFLEMFKIFFSVVREHHQQSLLQSMLSIMTHILEERVTQPVLDVIMRNLVKEEKGAAPASLRLAISLIQECTEKLEPPVRGFLTSCILDRDSVESELKEYYHEIIFELFKCAPQMLLAVIPSLSHELLTDQVDVRIKAVNLLGKLFALPGHHVVREYDHLFVEFLKRFTDKSVEVRISALQCAKACYTAIPSGTETLEVIAEIEGRLLDFDDKVRIQAVITICDLAKSNSRCVPSDLILHAMERLRDRKVLVRKNTMQKLLELYRDYCNQCSEGLIALGGHYEQIPCKILMLCYDKDCKDFRPQNMELVIGEDLFPKDLLLEERIRHWIFLFSVFTPAHVKAFHSILSQKWRLQMEMPHFLELRKVDKGNNSDEVREQIKTSCKKMSASFADPSKAEEFFQKLQQMKDEDIFNKLFLLLNEKTSVNADSRDLSGKPADSREELLKRFDNKNPMHEFLKTLASKCSFNIFSSEHVHHLLSTLSRETDEDMHLEASAVDLLLNVVSISPSLLRGSEEQLKMLVLKEDYPFQEKLLQIIVKSSRFISIKLSDIYTYLETMCLEGTRLQAKYASSVIAELGGASDALAILYEKLVDALHARQNISAVLQSLGCIAQYSLSTYESREKEITHAVEALFSETVVLSVDDQISFSGDSGCSTSCRLKIYALKTLVKSYLPHQGTIVRHQIKEFLINLMKILAEGNFSDDDVSSESDKAYSRLAAAKSVLQLARRWDAHIPPRIFHLVVLKARDPSSLVRRLFLDKIHKLLKKRAIPSRYACAFALAASDCLKDIQTNSLKYMEEFIKEQSKAAQIGQPSNATNHLGRMTHFPGYTVAFLIHVLAHDQCYPPENCEDEETYSWFCSPLIAILQALISACCADSNKNAANDTLLFMLNLFYAIGKAEDALDVHKTPRLHILADIGMLVLKSLSNNCMPFSPRGSMLLPSSLYKVCPKARYDKENMNFLTRCPLDENSIKKVLHFFQSNIIGTDCLVAKQSGKSQEASEQPRVKSKVKESDKLAKRTKIGKENPLQGKGSLKSAKQMDLQEISKQAPSPIDNGLVESIQHRNGLDGSGNSSLRRNEMSSSSGSVITLPSSAEIKVQCEKIREAKKIASSEPHESSEGGLTNHCRSKGVGEVGETLVGQRIKLWSPIDKCFYSGSVNGFDSQNSSHKVTYDHGEVELLCLAREKWEIECNASTTKEVKISQSTLSDSGVDSSIATLRGVETRSRKASKNQPTTTTDKRKGHIDNKHSSIVEGMETRKQKRRMDVDQMAVARRTRSRKG